MRKIAIALLLVCLAGCGMFPAPGSLLVTPEQVKVTPAPAPMPTGTVTTHATPKSEISTVEYCEVNTGVSGGNLHLRQCDSVNCAVVDVLREGERVEVLQAGAWLLVQTDDTVIGWVNSEFCERTKNGQ